MASRLTGNWSGILNLTKNLGKDVKKESSQYFNEEANNIKRDIQDTINNQSEPWADLKPNTIEKKGSNIKLKETGQLVNSIEVTPLGEDTYVISPQGTHSSGLTNSELAIIHEYGTNRIPPRPFIKPTHTEYEPKVPKEVSKIVSKTIKKYV